MARLVKLEGLYRGRKYYQNSTKNICTIYKYNQSVMIVKWDNGVDEGRYDTFTIYKFRKEFTLLEGEEQCDVKQKRVKTRYQSRKETYANNIQEIKKYYIKCFKDYVKFVDNVYVVCGSGKTKNYYYIKYKDKLMSYMIVGKMFLTIYVKRKDLLPKTFSYATKFFDKSTTFFKVMYKIGDLDTQNRETLHRIANDLMFVYSKKDI